MPSNVEGLKKKKINLKKTITKTANKVGGSIAKIATTGMDSNTKMVLKNMGKIKPAIKSFISK